MSWKENFRNALLEVNIGRTREHLQNPKYMPEQMYLQQK